MENLTEEILIEILKNFPADDIESAAKVCKRWYTIIFNSSKLANKPQLIFDLSVDKLDEALERSKGFPFRYIKMKARVFSESSDNLNRRKNKTIKEIFENQKDSVEQLTMEKYDKKLLINLFNETGINENLTKLELHYDNENDSAPVRFDFPNLKHLSVCMETTFIDLIRSHKIESLNIHEYYQKSWIIQVVTWQEFLKTCTNLKRLSVCEFFAFDISTYDFKIEFFEITAHGCRWHNEKTDIIRFLKAQREFLKDVKMRLVTAEDLRLIMSS